MCFLRWRGSEEWKVKKRGRGRKGKLRSVKERGEQTLRRGKRGDHTIGVGHGEVGD